MLFRSPHSDNGQSFEDSLPRVLVAPLIFATRRSHAVIALITEDPLIKQFSAQEYAENNEKLDRLRIEGGYDADQSVQVIALTEIKKAHEYACLITSRVKELIKEHEDDVHNAFTWACTQLSHVYDSESDSEDDYQAGDEDTGEEHIHVTPTHASATIAHYVPFQEGNASADSGAVSLCTDVQTNLEYDEQRNIRTDMHNTLVDLQNHLSRETHTQLLLQVLHECARVQEVTTHAQTLLEKEIAQRTARPAERRKAIAKLIGIAAGAFLAPTLQSYFAQEDTTDITDCACPGNTPGVILSAAHLLPHTQDATDREQLPHTAAVIEQLKALGLKLP